MWWTRLECCNASITFPTFEVLDIDLLVIFPVKLLLIDVLVIFPVVKALDEDGGGGGLGVRARGDRQQL